MRKGMQSCGGPWLCLSLLYCHKPNPDMYCKHCPINTYTLGCYPLGCKFLLYKHWLLQLLAHTCEYASNFLLKMFSCTLNTYHLALYKGAVNLEACFAKTLDSLRMQICSASSLPTPLRWISCANDGEKRKKKKSVLILTFCCALDSTHPKKKKVIPSVMTSSVKDQTSFCLCLFPNPCIPQHNSVPSLRIGVLYERRMWQLSTT